MGAKTDIRWTDSSWNPVTGCTEVSSGCDSCYAKTFAERWRGTPGHYFENGFDVTIREDKLTQPVRWTKPRMIFVNSMSDVFHGDIPTEYIAEIFAVMAAAPWHIFQVLTKRHARMRFLLRAPAFEAKVREAAKQYPSMAPFVWPLPNVWMGVSVEDQKAADLRIPVLLDTPAAVRFLSMEPLIGPVDLQWHRSGPLGMLRESTNWLKSISWVICGGESGAGFRPLDLDWAKKVRDQCVTAGVPFFFKQVGGIRPTSGGHELDGRTWDEYPPQAAALRSAA